ncbi:MAG TPA: DNA-binding response regulator [Bdellovibrionales bacterium]|nr:MAG: DNA-binding response regulator [Bdellovibrionales bacterium GWB1_52_6]OFZ03728.1 MAG: DNA-binding response regulator [Bdellovibrionales bacterium GWA1_52_35]OFZ41123.1 MAG: DNA-binding response regulator [Bdellovibrionales bacterium GWC1_52_8]HAR42239.1 DNA-binding response regulator [Bdellovibrionales bacterium]HCM38761.1 DNA-binding response regulator [Bdellovibrionales bacterium]
MRILVVEDEKKMADFIRRGLSEAGYSIDLAETGPAAETQVAENAYKLIVLDVMLPGQSGLDTARHLRDAGFSGPILMLTALSGTQDKVQGLDAGADDYLTKPFAFEELLARIRALLRRHTPQAQATLRFADLEMDLITRKIKRGSLEIVLTNKEFALLEYFLRNPESPLSRATISKEVWDVHFDPESNVIDVYINLLRKKMEADGCKRLVQTVVGVGYILKEPSA